MGTSRELSNRGLLVVVGVALVVFGGFTSGNVMGAPLVFAGIGVLLAVGLRALNVPRWLAGLGGFACFLALMTWLVALLLRNVN